jgi:hypothetical protein
MHGGKCVYLAVSFACVYVFHLNNDGDGIYIYIYSFYWYPIAICYCSGDECLAYQILKSFFLHGCFVCRACLLKLLSHVHQHLCARQQSITGNQQDAAETRHLVVRRMYTRVIRKSQYNLQLFRRVLRMRVLNVFGENIIFRNASHRRRRSSRS